MYKKFIITILGLGIVFGLWFFVVNKNKQTVDKVEIPTETSTKLEENPTNNSSEFGQAITLKLNDRAIFTDGLVVILTQIDDSRCPKNVQCVWAGEVSVVLELSGGKLLQPGEVHLGTLTTRSVSPEDYTLTLQNADEKSATIVVGYKKP